MNQDPKRLLLDPEMGAQLQQFDQHCEGQPFDLNAGLARFEAAIAAAPVGIAAGTSAGSSATAELGAAVGNSSGTATGIAAAMGTAPGAAAGSSGAAALVGLKGLLAAGALAGAGALAWNFWPVASSPSTEPATVPSQATSVEPSPAQPEALNEDSTSVKLAPDPLQAELALVKKARQALAQDQAAKALTLLQDSQAKFANGALVPEREALLIIALHQSGQVRNARSKARRFLIKHPQSPMSNRVRQVLEKKPRRRRR